jgi:deoxyribose-phosphate aldolase
MLTLTYEERDKFMMLITRFNESEEGKLPDGRLIMDIIGNHEEEERLEAELWATRLGAQAAYDMMFYGRVNGGNMEAIDQLPLEVRQLALENAVNRAILETGEINMLEKQAAERFQLAASESADWVEIE